MLDKFNKYKNSSGYINLDKAKVKYIEKQVFGSRKKLWLEVDDTLVLFKENMKSNEDIKEIINEEISKYLNIKCIESDLAIFENRPGIITLPFKEEQDLFLTVLILEFNSKNVGNSNDILSIYNALVENNASLDELEDIMNDYLKNQVQDIFTMQFDRNHHNSGIILSDKYSMAPRFDSSNSFFRIFDNYKINMFFNRTDQKEWVQKQNLTRTKLKITSTPLISSSMHEYITYRYLLLDSLPEIMQTALRNSDETLNKMLTLQLDAIFKKLKYYNININNINKKLFNYVIDYTKNDYEQEMNLIRKL